MRKFDFKLQKLLNYREVVERQLEFKYNISKKKFEVECDKLSEIKQNMDKVNLERNEMIGFTTINNFRLYNTYLNVVNKEIKLQNKKVCVAEEELIKAKDELINSEKEKKILERLKKRDLVEYNYNLKKEDEKLSDQIVSYNYSVK